MHQSEDSFRRRFDFAQAIALRAGRILSSFYWGSFTVTYKGVTDPLTDADTTSEKAIADAIAKEFPGDVLMAEEFHNGVQPPHSSYWCVDPLDGTVNFSHRLPWFNVSIAYVVDGRPVLGVVHVPVLGVTYAARIGYGATRNGVPISVSSTNALIKSLVATGFPYDRAKTKKNFAEHDRLLPLVQDVRRMGSAAIDICMVACGVLDAYYEFGLGPWDFAAGWVIAEEAGAVVTKIDGSLPDLLSREVLISNPNLHTDIVKILNEKDGER